MRSDRAAMMSSIGREVGRQKSVDASRRPKRCACLLCKDGPQRLREILLRGETC